MSNFRQLLEYIIILFLSYLILSGIVSIIGWINYREVLTSYGQIYAFLLIYWWIPIPRMIDIEEQQKKTKMTKTKKFLKDVMHEINMIKKHTTKEEKDRLDFSSLDYTCTYSCIYGQLTGECDSERAKEIMDVSCIRVMHLSDGPYDIANLDIENEKFVINGEYEGQTWVNDILNTRLYRYLSALEAYICTKDAKNEQIIKYIKGETNTLCLT